MAIIFIYENRAGQDFGKGGQEGKEKTGDAVFVHGPLR